MKKLLISALATALVASFAVSAEAALTSSTAAKLSTPRRALLRPSQRPPAKRLSKLSDLKAPLRLGFSLV